MTSALICTTCTHGVQEKGAIGLVVFHTAGINHMFRNTFPMRHN